MRSSPRSNARPTQAGSPRGHVPAPLSAVLSLAALLAALFISPIACDDGLEEVSSNGIGVEPRVVNFTTIGIGEAELRSVEILQLGADPLRIERIYLESVSGAARRDDCDRGAGAGGDPFPAGSLMGCDVLIDARPELPLELAPGARTQVTLRYRPERPIDEQEQLRLVIESDALDTPRAEVEISFASEAPRLVVEEQISFPGQGGVARIGLLNEGAAALAVSALSVEARDPNNLPTGTPAEFVLDDADLNAIPLTLDANGGAREIIVRFDPAPMGSGAAALLIESNDPSRPNAEIRLLSSTLSATLNASPERISFSGAGEQRLSLTNNGLRSINLEAFSFEPAGLGLSLVGAVPEQLEAGAGTELQIAYDGSEVGEAALLIRCDADNASGGAVEVPISLGNSLTLPELSAAPATVFFNGVAPGAEGEQRVTLSSVGIGPVTISGASLDPMGDQGFEIVSGGEAGVLEEGASRELVLRFTRAADDRAQRANSLSVTSDSVSPLSILLFADP